jgi:hypothetical protein
MRKKLNTFIFIFYVGLTKVHAGDIFIIGNSNVPKIDLVTIQKIYTGKIVSIANAT